MIRLFQFVGAASSAGHCSLQDNEVSVFLESGKWIDPEEVRRTMENYSENFFTAQIAKGIMMEITIH